MGKTPEDASMHKNPSQCPSQNSQKYVLLHLLEAKGESTTLELDLLAPLPEEELLTTWSVAERGTVEGIALLLWVIRVVAVVEASL